MSNSDPINSSSCYETAKQLAELCYETEWSELSESEYSKKEAEYEQLEAKFDKCVEKGYINGKGNLRAFYHGSGSSAKTQVGSPTAPSESEAADAGSDPTVSRAGGTKSDPSESEAVTPTPTPTPTSTPIPTMGQGDDPPFELSIDDCLYQGSDIYVNKITVAASLAYKWLKEAEILTNPAMTNQEKSEILNVPESNIRGAIAEADQKFSQPKFDDLHDTIRAMREHMEDGVKVTCASNWDIRYWVYGWTAWVPVGSEWINIPNGTLEEVAIAESRNTKSLATILIHEASHAAADTGDKTEDNWFYERPAVEDAWDIHKWFGKAVFEHNAIHKELSLADRVQTNDEKPQTPYW